jgi:TetR/AcrR family transcriptional regulator, transcriptional repressor for nem operon
MSDTRTELLDAAAELIQVRGYNGFSFHQLAAAVGIKTASIHYHFPSKAALGQALARRYTTDFIAALGDPDAGTLESNLKRYVGLFRSSLQKGRMCLCGMIGAEVADVPVEVAAEARAFFDANEVWLVRLFERAGATRGVSRGKARLLVSTLEGAMLMARVREDVALFDELARGAVAAARS